ncbi:MAG: sulfatase [Bacteroidota bacterium]
MKALHLCSRSQCLWSLFGMALIGPSGLFAQEKPPNIVLILVDDLGWKDVGFMGSPFYQTPHLDSLAAYSLIFEQAYAGAANCAPSRAILMSGQHAPRHGIYTVSPSARGRAEDRKLIPTPNTQYLADSMLTLAEALQAGGYVTGTFGKWHLGFDPLSQGFDINVGGSARGNPGRNGYFSPYKIDHITDGPDGEYLTDRLTSEAIQFIENQQDTQFFLYLPFYTVHTPLIGPEALVEKYRGLSPKQGQGHKPNYAAMIERMDHNVGRILSALRRLDLQNTLIIFTSDNGGIASVSRQWPLRAGKGSYYEGGIRVPLLMHWPGKIAPHQRTQLPISFLDFFPTILELIDLAPPQAKVLDGTSLAPYVLGEEAPKAILERPLFWHFPIYLEAYRKGRDDGRDPLFRTRPGSVIRSGKWKLHQYFEDGALELYDLSQDPGERINLAAFEPEIREAMLGKLGDWRERYQAPVPDEANPAYRPRE